MDIINIFLKSKKAWLIRRDRPVLNKNISSVKLFLFDNNQNFERFYNTVILFYYVIWYVGYGYIYVSYDTLWYRSKKFDFLLQSCSLAVNIVEHSKRWIK